MIDIYVKESFVFAINYKINTFFAKLNLFSNTIYNEICVCEDFWNFLHLINEMIISGKVKQKNYV